MSRPRSSPADPREAAPRVGAELATPAPPARALSRGDFRRVAENGFGDGSNSYAYSAAWHDGHLYVGSNRDIVPLLIMRSPFRIPFAVPPVPLPNDYTDLDLRGQIWRYSPASGHWTRVYHAPLIEGYEGRPTPQAFGFRAMASFQGASDSRPAIYTIPAVGRHVLQGVTLRSLDGEHFEALPAPQVPGSDVEFGSFRAMVAFKGQLFVAPSATRPPPAAKVDEQGQKVYITHVNTSRESAVLVSADPASGEWRLSSPPVFGDSTNSGIIEMAVCGDYLYAGTLNVLHGFQLWRTTAEGPPPHRWEKVLERGADRGAYNQAVLSMAAFGGSLYVGTCIQNGGYDRVNHIGPAAGEVLRVHPDGRWDLVIGDPRLTRHGLKAPTSGMRAGFNNPLTCYIWRICAHDGALYVGTCDNSSFVPFSETHSWPAAMQDLLTVDNMESFLRRSGGCELWRTCDGDNWAPVTRNGFGNRYNLGVRALVSTPLGLFAGTANPFGPSVAVREGARWTYQPNPRGGLEIWLGSPSSHGAEPAPLPTSEPPTEEQPARYALRDAARCESEIALNPYLRLSASPDVGGLAPGIETEIAEYFGGPLRNVGFWRHRSMRPIDACRELARDACARLPESLASVDDPAVLVTGRGEELLAEEVASRLPKGRVYPAPSGEWPDSAAGMFDAVVAIEAAGGVDRPGYLSQLARLLKPGGTAVVADFIASPDGDLAALERKAAQSAGLELLEAHDLTARTWAPFFDHSRSYWLLRLLLRRIDTEVRSAVFAALPGGNAGARGYAMCVFQKPDQESQWSK